MKKLLTILFVSLSSHVAISQITYSWATGFGGMPSYSDRVKMVKDNLGNVYITGEFQGVRMFGSISLTAQGYNDIYVAKFDPTGACLWAIKGGNPPSGVAYSGGITIDNSYNIYVTGYFSNIFNLGVQSVIATGNSDVFIACLTNNGNCVWLKHAGGNYDDRGVDLVYNSNGFIHITGNFVGQVFFDAFTVTNTSTTSPDIFLAKYDLNGNCVNLKRAGGLGVEEVIDIEIDNSHNLLLGGLYEAGAIFGGVTLTSQGAGDLFIAKYDDINQYLTWVASGGGHGNDPTNGISVDASNNVYITGSIGDTAVIGTTTLLDNGYGSIFVAKLNSTGTWQWVKKAGGSSTDGGFGISTNASGFSYVTGFFHGTANFSGTNVTAVGGSNDNDAFVAMYDKWGGLLFVTKIGGVSYDVGRSIISSNTGACIVAGEYTGNVIIGSTTLTSAAFTWNTFLTTMNGPTAIESFSSSDQLAIYPNPADDFIKINFESVSNTKTLELINSMGQVVEKLTVPSNKTEIITDTKNLTEGVYFVKITNDSKVYFQKFLVVHPR